MMLGTDRLAPLGDMDKVATQVNRSILMATLWQLSEHLIAGL